jgi:hypothetical protein
VFRCEWAWTTEACELVLRLVTARRDDRATSAAGLGSSVVAPSSVAGVAVLMSAPFAPLRAAGARTAKAV